MCMVFIELWATGRKRKIQNENMCLRRESNQWPLAFQRVALTTRLEGGPNVPFSCRDSLKFHCPISIAVPVKSNMCRRTICLSWLLLKTPVRHTLQPLCDLSATDNFHRSQRSQQGPRSVPARLQRSRRLIGDLVATKSVAARFLCLHKNLAATDLVADRSRRSRRPVPDQSPTSRRPIAD